jgi:hypothetical protein
MLLPLEEKRKRLILYLIDQYSMHVEQYCKIGDHKWVFSEYADPEAELNLASVPCQIVLADIYDKVEFNAEE